MSLRLAEALWVPAAPVKVRALIVELSFLPITTSLLLQHSNTLTAQSGENRTHDRELVRQRNVESSNSLLILSPFLWKDFCYIFPSVRLSQFFLLGNFSFFFLGRTKYQKSSCGKPVILKSSSLQGYFVWSYRPVEGSKGKVTRQELCSAGRPASAGLSQLPSCADASCLATVPLSLHLLH